MCSLLNKKVCLNLAKTLTSRRHQPAILKALSGTQIIFVSANILTDFDQKSGFLL